MIPKKSNVILGIKIRLEKLIPKTSKIILGIDFIRELFVYIEEHFYMVQI